MDVECRCLFASIRLRDDQHIEYSNSTGEPCKNGYTDQDAVWVEDSGGPGNHVLDGGPDTHGKGQFFWRKGVSQCKA